MNIRLYHMLLAVIIGFVFWQLMIILSDVFVGTSIQRLFLLLGGSTGVGFLKLLIYIAFTYAIIDLSVKFKSTQHEHKGFHLEVLSAHESFTHSNTATFRDQIVSLEKDRKSVVGKECVQPCRSRWSPYH